MNNREGRDGDGVLTTAEFAAHMRRVDADGDGKIYVHEASGAYNTLYSLSLRLHTFQNAHFSAPSILRGNKAVRK